MRLSIRWRLTLWNTLAVALVLLGFATLVYALMTSALYRQADRKLLSGLRQVEQDRHLESDPAGRLRYWADELHEHEGIFTAVYGADGRVRERTVELPEVSVPPLPERMPAQPQLHDGVVPALGRQRLLEARLQRGGQSFTIVLMTSLEEVDRALARLRATLLLAVPVALAVSGALGYLLARTALAPVEQLRRRTREITADRLDRRLPVVNAGDELGQLAETINEMIGRLQRSFAEVRRFTADASHELRTPLTAIRIEAEVALGKPDVAGEQRHLLGSILEECGRLTRLTDQLLALSRADAGVAPQARDSLDLSALVAGVIDTMRPLAEAGGVRLHGGGPPVRVVGDAARLRQVFSNLIDNGIKYTPEGGEVAVRVESQSGAAVASVCDTGEGIAAEHLPRVFDRFYRVDKARSREQGGTGLGLSIVKSIVVAHGGAIELTSTPGHGTTCTVTLPEAPKA